MQKIRKGDLVIRPSHNGDILFRVEGVKGNQVRLKGVTHRLCADAPISDISKADDETIARFRKKDDGLRMALVKSMRAEEVGPRDPSVRAAGGRAVKLPGKILHLDGDHEYLTKCLDYYRKANVRAVGVNVPESSQASQVQELIRRYKPDLLVLTGHDGLKKGADKTNIRSYVNSSNYVAAVNSARQLIPDPDALPIMAGACQSYYEAIREAGANFASAPQRVLIDTYDPAAVAGVLSQTLAGSMARVEDVVGRSITGVAGIGGMDTRGTARYVMPEP